MQNIEGHGGRWRNMSFSCRFSSFPIGRLVAAPALLPHILL